MAMIYVVEDDEGIREIEMFSLKNSGYSVKGFECAKDFYKKIGERVPDLIILDIMLPDDDGLAIVKKLRNSSTTSKVPIILVTAKTTEIDKVKGLDVGADDYITKPFGVMEFISRVKAMLRRSGLSYSEKVLQIDNIVLDDEKREVYVNDEQCELTFKEYELLKLLMKNSGVVMTRDIIMEKVWDANIELESRTIDVHIKTLRNKLRDEAYRIRTVRNVGYVIE